MKIGDLATICNVSVKTIRFYESKGLLHPAEVDRWTGYRYYNEESVKRLSEILYLKKLGFTLEEISNFDEEQVKNKTKQLILQLSQIKKNIQTLNSLTKNNKGEFVMNNFINDEKAIGKWKKIAVVKDKEEFYKGKHKDDKTFFPFQELYLMPNGEQYWVVSWTKGFINIKDRKNPYTIEDDKMFVGVVDYKDNQIYNYAVYEKADSNIYKPENIGIRDNINIPFVEDKSAIGFWEVVDLIHPTDEFKPSQRYRYCKDVDIWLRKLILYPNGEAIQEFRGDRSLKEMAGVYKIKWSKGLILSQYMCTASEYVIKSIEGKDYLIMEWKSGDYAYGGKVNCHLVFKRIDG